MVKDDKDNLGIDEKYLEYLKAKRLEEILIEMQKHETPKIEQDVKPTKYKEEFRSSETTTENKANKAIIEDEAKNIALDLDYAMRSNFVPNITGEGLADIAKGYVGMKETGNIMLLS